MDKKQQRLDWIKKSIVKQTNELIAENAGDILVRAEEFGSKGVGVKISATVSFLGPVGEIETGITVPGKPVKNYAHSETINFDQPDLIPEPGA